MFEFWFFYSIFFNFVICQEIESWICFTQSWSARPKVAVVENGRSQSGRCEASKKTSAIFDLQSTNSDCFSVTYFVSCTETRFSAWFSASDIFKLFVKVTYDSEGVWPTCSSPKWSEFKCLTKPRHILVFSFLLSKIRYRTDLTDLFLIWAILNPLNLPLPQL